MNKYLVFLASLGSFGIQAAFPLTTVYKGVQVLQPAPMGQIGATCGYHAVYNGAAALQHVRGGRPLSHRSFTFDRADRDVLFNPSGVWGAFASAQHDPEYAGVDNLESEIISLLIEKFVPEVGDNFVVFDNAQQFLSNKFAKFNAGVRTITNTTLAGTTSRTEEIGAVVGRERFWSVIRGMAANQTPFEFLFIINTGQAVQGAIGGEHWIMVLFHKDAAGVHSYYVADTGGSYLGSPLVTGIIDEIENPAGRIASAHEIAWAFGGGEEAEEISQNERIAFQRQEEEQRMMDQALRESHATAMAYRPTAVAVDDDIDFAQALSLSIVQQQQQDAELQKALRESTHLERVRRQQQELEEQEAAQLAAVMAESELLEKTRVQRAQGEAQRREQAFLTESRLVAERQQQQREEAQRRLRLQEEAEIAQALALSLQQQQLAPAVAPRRQPPAVAPRPRPVVVAPQDAPRSAQSAVVELVRPSVAPRPGVVPVVQQRHQFPVAEERPMTVMERILAQQRAEFERLEREKGKR